MTRSFASYVLGYGCVTAAGQGSSALMDGLIQGKDHSVPADPAGWPRAPGQAARICRIAGSSGRSHAERMAAELRSAFAEATAGLEPDRRALLGQGLGIIFASTKGAVEDLVWRPGAEAMQTDTLSPVLARFLAITGLKPRRAVCISNACSSVHAALRHASLWLEAGVVRDVLVLAADHVGPFVVNGFAALKSLASERVTPFAAGRQGIQLGEVAAAILISKEPAAPSDPRLGPVELLTEGHALTRSRDDGATLKRVATQALAAGDPDVIVAHGTGTEANDAMEDRVYREFSAPVTCTKWSVGHGLGASGAVDFVAAAEMLRRGILFGIGNTETPDPAFSARYLTRGQGGNAAVRRALICSVGFGGMHAAALLEAP